MYLFSKVMAIFNHVDGSFNLFLATTGDVWIIPSFRIWGYVLHVGVGGVGVLYSLWGSMQHDLKRGKSIRVNAGLR